MRWPSSRAIAGTRGPTSTSGPTVWPRRCSTAPAWPSRTSRAVPLQLAAVPRVGVRRVQGGLVVVNTNYRYADDELRLPLGQRRCRRRGVPRHLRRDDRDAFATACRGSPPGSGSTTAAGACPDWATPYEAAATAGTRDRRLRRVGSLRRRPVAALHRRDHRDAQGRDVAPGRPVRRARRRTTSKRHAARADLDSVAERVDDGRARATCRALRSCTAPGCSPPSATCWSAGRSHHGGSLDPREDARQRRANESQLVIIVGDAFAKPILARARRRTGPLGHHVAAGHGLVGRHVVQGDQGRIPPTTTHD